MSDKRLQWIFETLVIIVLPLIFTLILKQKWVPIESFVAAGIALCLVKIIMAEKRDEK